MKFENYYITILTLLFTGSVVQVSYGQVFGVPGTGNGNLIMTEILLSEETTYDKVDFSEISRKAEKFAHDSGYIEAFLYDFDSLDIQDFRTKYEYFFNSADYDGFRSNVTNILEQDDPEPTGGFSATGISRQKKVYISQEAVRAVRYSSEFTSYLEAQNIKCESNNTECSRKVTTEKEEPFFPQLGVNFESANKEISANTQFVIFPKADLNYLLGIGARVSGEGDFANLFSNGEISSTGGLSATFALGKINSKGKLHKDLTIRGEPKDYKMIFFSYDPDFINLKSILDPSTSLSTATSRDVNHKFRLGANGFYSFVDHFNILGGVTFSFGQTNNISLLKKGNITTFNNSIGDTTLVSVQNDTYIGNLEEYSFTSLSMDALISFHSLGLYVNIFTTNFDFGDLDDRNTKGFNIGLYFNEKKEDDAKTKFWYQPKFGLIFSRSNRDKFSFGIAGNLTFGAFNKPKPKAPNGPKPAQVLLEPN